MRVRKDNYKKLQEVTQLSNDKIKDIRDAYITKLKGKHYKLYVYFNEFYPYYKILTGREWCYIMHNVKWPLIKEVKKNDKG